MAIIRGEFPHDTNYTMIPNNVLRDKGLSLKARGLLAEMLSHRPGWVVHRDSLESERDGRSAIQSAINELKDAGVLEVERVKDEKGLLTSGVDYRLSHARWEGSPKADFPTLENPTLENRPYKKTNSKEDYKNTPPSDPDGFDEWWAIYPKKEGKAYAKKCYSKALRSTSKENLLSAVTRFKNEKWNVTPSKENLKYCPLASTWLNKECWSDWVQDSSVVLVEASRLVGEGRVSELSRLLGVKVPVPDFGDVGPQETIRLRSEWLAEWWAVEGKKLL